VRHFKFTPRGRRRIHQKPRSAGIAARKPWVREEIRIVKPKVVVCLGRELERLIEDLKLIVPLI
jgi:uracil-DNA glycosylase